MDVRSFCLPRFDVSSEFILTSASKSLSISKLYHPYRSLADDVLNVLTDYILTDGFPIRLFAFKVKMEAARFRYGALEVSLGFWSGKEWVSGCLHSKLASQSWPAMSRLKKKAENFICEMITQINSATFLKSPPPGPKSKYLLRYLRRSKEMKLAGQRDPARASALSLE